MTRFETDGTYRTGFENKTTRDTTTDRYERCRGATPPVVFAPQMGRGRMAMQGYQIVAYDGENVVWPSNTRRPMNADVIRKSWVPTRTQAQAEKHRMENDYPNAIVVIE